MRPFIKVAEAAFDAAVKEGKISRFQKMRAMIAIRMPRFSAEVESLTSAEMAVALGTEPGASGLIDWENFDPEKFLALVETIIMILKLFGIGV